MNQLLRSLAVFFACVQRRTHLVSAALPLCPVWEIVFDALHFFGFAGLAVLAACLNALAVGAPLVPGLRMVSSEPAAMRAFLAAIFA